MVNPIDLGTHPRRTSPGWLTRAIVGLGLTLFSTLSTTGCGVISQSKMDEYHRVTQNLRAENTRLKDVSLDLRSRNQDLSQRAVDDAKRLSTQEEVVTRLENSVEAYQAEREKLAEAFETLKRQVQIAASSNATQASTSTAKPITSRSRLEAFAEGHEGWTFDPVAKVLSVPMNRLFERGRDRLTADAIKALNALSLELVNTEATAKVIEVVALDVAPPPVEKAGFNAEDRIDPRASARFLSTARATRVREQLVGRYGLAPKLVRIVAPPVGAEIPAEDSGRLRERRVEIRLASKGKNKEDSGGNDSLPDPVEGSDP